MSRDRRPVFVSWIRYHGRSATLAEAVDAECHFVAVGTSGRRYTAPLRYLTQTVLTLLLLARKRPRTLIVMAPPDSLVLVALAYARLTAGRVVVDAHTAAVLGSSGALRSRFVLLAKRALVTWVTNEQLAESLAGQGVRAQVVHDPPMRVSAPLRGGRQRSRMLVVMPASWYVDEPWEVVVDAARELSDVRFVLTGRPPQSVLATRDAWPTNVELTGFLEADAYGRLLASADIVLALTTRDHTMQQAGYEAMAHHRPLIASDTTVLREYFTAGTLFVDGSVASLVAAVREVRRRNDLEAGMARLCEQRAREFDKTKRTLREIVTTR